MASRKQEILTILAVVIPIHGSVSPGPRVQVWSVSPELVSLHILLSLLSVFGLPALVGVFYIHVETLFGVIAPVSSLEHDHLSHGFEKLSNTLIPILWVPHHITFFRLSQVFEH